MFESALCKPQFTFMCVAIYVFKGKINALVTGREPWNLSHARGTQPSGPNNACLPQTINISHFSHIAAITLTALVIFISRGEHAHPSFLLQAMFYSALCIIYVTIGSIASLAC